MSDWPYSFEGELWEYQGEAPWVFMTLPQDLADRIDEDAPESGGFGSIKVEVNVGASEWSTSLFPDKSTGSFVLPVKQQIRSREDLTPGDQAVVRIRLLIDRG